MEKHTCNGIEIGEDVCYIKFGEKTKKYVHSEDDFETVRGETMIIDFDEDGRVMGIELLGDKKPCQKI